MKSRRTLWLIFWAGCAALAAVLVWVSAVVLRLESESRHHASMRLALWRMDSWLGPRLAREANRPYFEYMPFYAQQRAYTKLLNPIDVDEVYSPSPLLTFTSELFPLHFQVSGTSEVTSPQAPTGNWRDLAESGYVPLGEIERKQPLLEKVKRLVGPANFDSCVAQAETTLARLMREEEPDDEFAAAQTPQAMQQWAAGGKQAFQTQQALSKADVQRRAQYNSAPQQEAQTIDYGQQEDGGALAFESEAVEVGALVPLWLPERPAQGLVSSPLLDVPPVELLFVRRVRIGGETIQQGMLADWPAIRAALAEQVADLFPRARLEPLTDAAAVQAHVESGRSLASIPVLLDAPCPSIAGGPLITPARTTLGLAWLAVVAAIGAGAVTLRSSLAYGEKRSRFASAVTHELRTPLTTFRMYSEMLAEGMVRDEAQRKTYLETLKTESARLATLVENVLWYARLEEGRGVSHAQRTTVAGLLARTEGVLRRRAADAGMELRVRNEAPPETALVTDPEVVGQILFNLVDNACKYASAAKDRTLDLAARIDDHRLSLSVIDRGPGVPPECARRIFAPFDRGHHGPGDTIPGVGLGLALARGLARDLGGELALEHRAERGACFRLSLDYVLAPKA